MMMALGTMPYGAPVPAWYRMITVALTVSLVISLGIDPVRRWRSLVLWPIPVILVAWSLSVATCNFPREVALRANGLVWFSPAFVAAQVICWRTRALKLLVVSIVLMMIVMAVDLWWQLGTTRSLIREIRAPEYKPDGSIKFMTLGSLGNQNDQAVTAILLPLCMSVVSSWWAWCLLLIGAIPTGYLAITGKSRQLALGAVVALSSVTGLHAKPKLRLWAVASLVVLSGAIFAAAPGVRERFANIASNPLGDRGLPMVYGVDLFLHNPLFGVGPSLYGHYYVLGVREGWSFHGQPLLPIGTPWVHSLPIEIACELGIVGLSAFGFIMWKCAGALRRGLRRPGPARNMSVAVIGSALSMATVGLIDLSFIKDWVCIVWWLVLGLGFAAPMIAGEQTTDSRATLSDSNGL
jgi:hypothetical protein